jgi:hypothetical protein
MNEIYFDSWSYENIDSPENVFTMIFKKWKSFIGVKGCFNNFETDIHKNRRLNPHEDGNELVTLHCQVESNPGIFGISHLNKFVASYHSGAV